MLQSLWMQIKVLKKWSMPYTRNTKKPLIVCNVNKKSTYEIHRKCFLIWGGPNRA